MNRLIRKLPLQVKLLLIGLIPIGFLIYLTLQLYREKSQKLILFENYKAYINESQNINNLINALQEERKFSFDYSMTKKRRAELLTQRPLTDEFIEKLKASNDPALIGFDSYTKLGQLNEIRKKVDDTTIGPNEVMHFYSNTVFRLNTLNTIPPASTAYLQLVYRDLMAQKILSEMITYLGIIRSNIYNVLHTRLYMVETLFGTIGSHDIYLSYEAELKAKAEPKVLNQYQQIRTSTSFKPTVDYIDTLFKTFKFDDRFTASGWWDVSDNAVQELRNLQASIWQGLTDKINVIHQQEISKRKKTLLLLVLALSSVVFIVAYIVSIISTSLIKLRDAAEKISNGLTDVDIQVESNDVVGYLAQSISNINKNNQVLAEAAAAIGQGNFDISVQPRSPSDQLGNAIVEMKKDLLQYNQKMEQLVAERTDDLARSNEDLQQFAHVASHDLKEPLRKISIFCDLLTNEQNSSLSEQGKRYLEKIAHSSNRMSNMIEGILAYSTGDFNEPDYESIDLTYLLQGVLTDLEMVIQQKDAKIDYHHLPVIQGNPFLLQQLFYNLLNNSLKFSNPSVKPVITIQSNYVDKANQVQSNPSDYLHLEFKDNGIGFNPAYAEKIFGIFTRLHAKDKFEGTGLGLALCKKIVQRHGGKIYAESEEGKGATFHIILPISGKK